MLDGLRIGFLFEILKGPFNEFPPFGTYAASNRPDIQKRKHDGSNRKKETAHPVEQEQQTRENWLQDRFAPDEEAEGYC
jgi:hypothetical protein